MNSLVWRNIGRFVLLTLLQLLVLNNVYLGGYVMPLLYVLFILMLPTSTGRVPMLLMAFGMGLLMDIMAGSLGFHALACTIVAMMRITFADRILTRGENVVEDCLVRSFSKNCLVSAVWAACCWPRCAARSSPRC